MKVLCKIKENRKVQKIYSNIIDLKYSILTIISPTLSTKTRYKAAFGKELNLSDPKTLNEKILWLKLNRYMNDPLVIQCADKYRVREYLKQCGCSEILNELIGVYDKAEEIPWEQLPDQFVLKWNFGAGMNIICTDKNAMDKNKVIKQLNKWGRSKYWLPYAEMQYKYTPKKIICEKLINE